MIKQQIILDVACPGCNRRHLIMQDRFYIEKGVAGDKPVQLYWTTSDRFWEMTEQEKVNTKRAFAQGTI